MEPLEICSRLGRPVVVQKYGGSSVATAEHVRRVARRIVERKRAGAAVAVVVSAMGKTTDELLELARQVHDLPPRRELDMLLHAGEIVSAALLAMAIEKAGERAVSLTGFQAGMVTDSSHTQARIRAVEAARVTRELEAGRVVVIAGFQGATPEQEITTLGRGGSDTSAVAIAVGIGAQACEILTDVDGVYTADPRVVSGARLLKWCSYDEMLELASLGARVLHSRSVEIARRFDMPLRVASSFGGGEGTLICSAERGRKEFAGMEEIAIRGVTHRTDVVKVSLVGVPDQPGVAARIFETIGRHDVNILLIVQAEHHAGRNDISFLIAESALPLVRRSLAELSADVQGREVVVDENVGTVSVVGEGVQREPGVAARMFRALAQQGVNIDLISTSNLMITCVVARDQVEEAVRAVHREFLEGEGAAKEAGKDTGES